MICLNLVHSLRLFKAKRLVRPCRVIYPISFSAPGGQTGALSPGLFLRVLKAIRFLTHGGPLVLAIEDLQWASSATLRLFGFLAARLHDLPVLLIGTVHRTDEIPALTRLLVVGRRRGEVQLITLDPLPSEAIAELLRASQVASPSLPSLGAWLEERSGGNPYLLGELLAQLRSEAILTRRRGRVACGHRSLVALARDGRPARDNT